MTHPPTCPCEECVLGRRTRRMARTPSMYPSSYEPEFSLLPVGEALYMAQEDLAYFEAKVREKKADIRVLMDCAAPEAA
jgi:hypothetical protein